MEIILYVDFKIKSISMTHSNNNPITLITLDLSNSKTKLFSKSLTFPIPIITMS